MMGRAYIPYGAWWSTPFCRWQGSLAGEHALELVARVAREALAARRIPAEALDALILGTTVPQRAAFYGAPWVAAMLGAPGITGATVAQACATSARVLASAALEVECGLRGCVLGLAGDRTSNGPHVYYPDPAAPGGRGTAEDWVWDNFQRDPHAGASMVQTAENVARAEGYSRAEQDAVALLRHEQYREALAHDRAFQRRYMVPVTLGRGRRARVVEADEGVHPTDAEGLAALAPVLEGGTVTYGTQTHPADGNAGVVVATEERARELSRDPSVAVRLVSFGEARVEPGRMPTAVVPAARQALSRAGVAIGGCKAIRTHNPFAVNDLYFSRQTGVAPEAVNRYGSPLVYGHPQGPTGCRLVIEMVEELVQSGGGYGLFAGCAAGDTAMAVVVRVG
ncbi:MAG: thiolase family protein [Planctomycetes bacterium]|nr:thiolase family protein [Planctomycetota bacterium]